MGKGASTMVENFIVPVQLGAQLLDIMGQGPDQTNVGARPILACAIMGQGLEQANVGACPILTCARYGPNSDRHALFCFREGAFGRGRRLACPLAQACSYGCLASAHVSRDSF